MKVYLYQVKKELNAFTFKLREYVDHCIIFVEINCRAHTGCMTYTELTTSNWVTD